MRIRGRRQAWSGPSQVSMSDIAFLLLIFFLSTTIFEFEVGIPMVLPGLQASPVKVERSDVLTICTDERGALLIDGVPAILEQVEGMVRARLEENPKLIVHLVTHPRATYQTMIGLLDEVRSAGATWISLKLERS